MNDKPAYYKETIHSQKRRAEWHDYYGRGQYMVTIAKNPLCPTFGTLEYHSSDTAFISLSSVGLIIKGQIETTPAFSPEIRIHEFVVMPDHIHVLIEVLLPMRRHLGDVVQAIKAASSSRIRKLFQNPALTVFEEGFHDRIIRDSAQFETVYRYIRENPRRLGVRRAHPEFFRRVNELEIGGKTYQAYGNVQLLDNPFREQVVVHRADSTATRVSNRTRWLYAAANGGVLVSPFVSQAEKAIRSEAEAVGGRIILITNESMGERYKPSGRDFELCEQGRLLIVSAGLPGELSRSVCLEMNALAQTMAEAGMFKVRIAGVSAKNGNFVN